MTNSEIFWFIIAVFIFMYSNYKFITTYKNYHITWLEAFCGYFFIIGWACIILYTLTELISKFNNWLDNL